MKKHSPYACALLALGIPATALATDKEIEVFAASQYTYCDAKMLSGMWKESVWESKSMIGRKIGWGDQQTLNSALRKARGEARTHPKRSCDFWEAGLNYQDAEVLAGVWKLSIDESKAFVQEKILAGDELLVRQILAENGRKPGR
ncbi:hypothetical protein [Candidatus Accumulibacter sp. ACC003]|jgi:hypothetical protein|uniref:hypothetical protein n=1 Tax=Candidatus Accumulibacter sp. ACC003 TaxID=2823334 RepID=UPI0025BB62B3|nr:hypothetical protein [Candidatus Accumulibacter sp. ACC003]